MPILTPGQIQPRGRGIRLGAISVIFVSKASIRVTTLREMKYTSQRFCDKAMGDKVALYCENANAVIELYTIMVKTVNS